MNQNRFVWHDLNTRDAEGAKRFYGETFNWKFEKSDNGTGAYLHIKAGDQMIGGVRTMDANENTPPSWLGYIACDDVAATVAKVTAHGGKVMMPTMTMDKVGTFAVVADPTGAVFAPWKSARAGEDAETDNNHLFSFCWDELVTTDPAKAGPFYAQVFGWKTQEMDMGGGMIYTLFGRPGTKMTRPGSDPNKTKDAGGMMKAPPMVPHSFWMTYVAVDNCDAITEKAKRQGANIVVPPTDIPNVGRFSCWMDPQQAGISVLQPKM
jgi:predicted enzyme related to lactoylglutathione lyase